MHPEVILKQGYKWFFLLINYKMSLGYLFEVHASVLFPKFKKMCCILNVSKTF